MLLLEKTKRKFGPKNSRILRPKRPKMKDATKVARVEHGGSRDAQGSTMDALAPVPGKLADQDQDQENCEYVTFISTSDTDVSTRPFVLGSSPIDVSMLDSWFDSEGGVDLETTVVENRRQAGIPDPTLRGKKRWPPCLEGIEKSDSTAHTHPDDDNDKAGNGNGTYTHTNTIQNHSTYDKLQKNSTISPPLTTQTSVQQRAKAKANNNGATTLTKQSLKLLRTLNEKDNISNTNCNLTSISHQAVQSLTLLNQNQDLTLTDTVNDLGYDKTVTRQQQLQQTLELPKSNASSNGSRKSLLPLLDDVNMNANGDIYGSAASIPNLVKNSEMVEDWLARVPPLLPNELNFPLTPKKATELVNNANCELLSSPLKRRRICHNIDSDDYKDTDSPASTSKYAKELYRQARLRSLAANNEGNKTMQPEAANANCADGGGMDVDTISNSSVNIDATASTLSRLHRQQQQHEHNLEQLLESRQQPAQPQKTQSQQLGTNNDSTTNSGNKNGKIPILFLPLVPEIMPLIDMLTKNPAVGRFNTKTTANNGLRVQATNMVTYNAIKEALIEKNIPLHTHQVKQQKGFRIVIRKLHNSTPCSWITDEIKTLGFNTKFIRVIKHRFTGKPLNLFELELEPTSDGSHEHILKLEHLGNQTISVERQAKPRDPAQCHRCQAYGHTKNYCRRPFRCMKCAGDHPSTACKKPRSEKAKCVNCDDSHVSSYKGCVKFKKARDDLRANRVIGGKIYKQHPRQQQEFYAQHHPRQQQQQQYHQQQQQQKYPHSNNTQRSYSWIAHNGGNASTVKNSNNNVVTPQQHQQQPQQQNQQRVNNSPAQKSHQPRQKLTTPKWQRDQQQQQHQQVRETSRCSNPGPSCRPPA